jgi:hypothetical protein
MAGLYRQHHPERSVFYRVLFHYFESFLLEYESRFEREYAYFRPIIQEVTAGHHEAWKAVVISNCLAKGMRLLRHSVPRSKPRLWQSDVRVCPHPVSRLWGRAPPHVFLQNPCFL